MSDLGLLAYYLGIEVTQTKGDISIKQSAYANKILKEAGMLSNETVIPMDPGTTLTKKTEGTLVNSTEYRSLIGCLIYLLHTRPDLSYSVGLLSRFMQEPKEQHMKAIKQVLRYVKGTKDYGITYKHKGENKIQGFSDSSYGINTQECKGTTGIIFYYGDSPISWSTQKQATVALSSCESEFIAATAAATQALWLKRLLSRLTHTEEEKITIMVDNKSAIALMKNPVFHERNKHIDTKYHFIRECVERDDIQVEFVSEEHQKADILTKALPKIKISDFGLARLMNPIDTHSSTFINGEFGDLGYMAPEYPSTLVATPKGDVYSFGVVLLELVTGEKPTHVAKAPKKFKGSLVEWVIHLSAESRLPDTIDESLVETVRCEIDVICAYSYNNLAC
nr:ribonuclease H-like domain, reverse transcriptase, RNA-dependent DNA polymerase [Tanacetum cinerariifolium]